MKLKYNLDIEDWMEFQKNYVQNSRQFKKTKIIILSMLPIFSIVIISKDIMDGQFNLYSTLLYTIVSVAWIMLYSKRLTKRTLSRSRKLLEKKENENLYGEYNLTIDDNGITLSHSSSEEHFKWKKINKVDETDLHYFLYYTAVLGIIIPKTRIKSDLKELQSILKLNVK